MAYEAVVVIGFGVVLAVCSVALFWAHVKRINAPNKVDPEGTLVEIDLGTAIAKDQAARDRKVTARGHKSIGRRDSASSSTDSSSCGNRLSGVRKRASCAAGDGPVVLGDDVPETDTLQASAPSPSSSRTTTMVLPSSLWAEAILKHADLKRKKLRNMVQSGEIAAGWEATWERLPSGRKRKLLEAVREELVHAVSSYVGRDETLFDVICPNLSVDALEEEHRGVTGLSRLVRGCLDGKLPEPRSRAFAAVQEALVSAAAAENVPKDKRGPVRAFLPTFRKLCSCSFSIGALEAVVSGRADGSAGPTVSSFCAALVKTGGSGILMWAFFHGLTQMSAPGTMEDTAAGLPAAADAAGGL